MDMICYFKLLPNEIKHYIISFTKDKLTDLSLIDRYFNDNCKIVRITNNDKYPKLRNENLKELINLDTLNLTFNHIITDEGIKELNNITCLNLSWNEMITNQGISKLFNLKSLNLDSN